MLEFLFALILLAAVLAVIYDVYAEGVLAVALYIILLEAVQVVGPSLLFAAVLVVIVALFRLINDAAPEGDSGSSALTVFLDDLLTARDEPPDNERHRIWTDQGNEASDDDER